MEVLIAVLLILVLIVYLTVKGINKSSGYVKSNYNNDSVKWELVRRKTERWDELGFGDGDSFPGYGKLYNREFKVWYCDINSKEKKDIQTFRDVNVLNYDPKRSIQITGPDIYLEPLRNTMQFAALYTGLDNKNRKRWYFALVAYSPTGIQTDRASELAKTSLEIENEILIPEGWTLVRRASKEWFENGFGDNKLFPGYGKIYERTFDVWYCKVGSKQKNIQPEFKDKAILNLKDGICGDLNGLKEKRVYFDPLFNTQGYKTLLSALDSKERIRWYFGLKEAVPTFIFTAPYIYIEPAKHTPVD
jgi:hypothetical protein